MTSEDQSRSEFEAWWKKRRKATWMENRCRGDAEEPREHWGAAFKPHALEAWQASRTAALEEAAKACEDMHDEDRPSDYAYAIRALAGGTKEG